jgi:subtilisin family serine protease
MAPPLPSSSGLAESSRPLNSLLHQITDVPSPGSSAQIYGYSVPAGAIRSDFGEINLGNGLLHYNGSPKRTLVFGSGDPRTLFAGPANVVGLGSNSKNGGGGFLGVAVSQNPLPAAAGLVQVPDMPLAFDGDSGAGDYRGTITTAAAVANGLPNYSEPLPSGRFSGASIIGADRVAADYGINGTGVTVAIVDTGTDFSNPDMRHAVARDKNGVPIMLDADGHGIVLTRAKYVANIDFTSGRIMDYVPPPAGQPLPQNATSYVYVNATGVFLKTSQGKIPVYNTLYPFFGTPVLEGVASVDWKIGNSPTDYIVSKSGIYRFGVEFQLSTQYGVLTTVLVPVLVVDSQVPGVYDTIIPDMSYAWHSFTMNVAGPYPNTNHLIPDKESFDFTDERPIRLGDGNEFLTYDYDKDGYDDYSAGTVGARVLDIWRVIDNKTQVSLLDGKSGYGGVISAKLLKPMDPAGEYFGIMYDFQGHGTSTAATVASKGAADYGLYNNSTKYRLPGMAPGAKILPVKALWAGDAIYGWLYAAGFDNNSEQDGRWRYTGDHRADIISNSWGISNFPLLKYGPGYDVISAFSSLLMVPDLLARGYPGTVIVDSAGNNGVGYGSVGAPNISPFAISVGATTNHVHVQYGPFANVTRFGSSVAAYDDIADFSSRGPGMLGDPKPELMAVGSYGFTPADVTVKTLHSKKDDANNNGAFTLFGGTSMAAPMVAGAAALVIQELKADAKQHQQQHQPSAAVDPFLVKSVLMSTAKDLKNDPFVQGSGRVDALAAVELARGQRGRFSVYTEDTAKNILETTAPAMLAYYNSTFAAVIDHDGDGGGNYPVLQIGQKGNNTLLSLLSRAGNNGFDLRESRWFAGQVEQGGSASADIIVDNPSDREIKVQLSSTIEKLVTRYEVHNSTRLFVVDPARTEKQNGFAPNYYNLEELAGGRLPGDADLLVARVNFPFSSFMNSTETFADHLRIASVYAYDWHDANGDGKVGYGEATMVNRGGAWGTTQEVRVGDPSAKFRGTPVIGVYPVPTVLSFWRGDRLINSTSMNYTLTVELYKRTPNPNVQLGGDVAGDGDSNYGNNGAVVDVTVPAKGKAKVVATVTAPDDAISGVYYGEVEARLGSSDAHPTAAAASIMPVSYVVTTKPVPKDVPVVVSPSGGASRLGPEAEWALGLRPNGYVGGLSDMISRYSAGDWRSYYFKVADPTMTSMNLKVSWPHNSTSINAMAFGPDGRMVASSVPAGVFQEFAGWASNDWLGTSAVSEGGAFFFAQNSGSNSTVMHVPVNGTGVYSVLLHNTLFHGESLYEPVVLEAKFSTLLPDTAPPRIKLDVPRFLPGDRVQLPVAIDDQNPSGSVAYFVDGRAEQQQQPRGTSSSGNSTITIDGSRLAEGPHLLRVESTDTVGHSAYVEAEFTVDKTPPAARVSIMRPDGSLSPAVVVLGNDKGGDDDDIASREKGRTGDKIFLSRGSTLIWNVTDLNGVKDATAIIGNNNNNDNLTTFTGDHGSFVNDRLADGRYNFTVISADAAGNRLYRTWTLVSDSVAPSASMHFAGWGEQPMLSGRAHVDIRAADNDGGSGVKTAILAVGQETVDTTGLSEYELDTSRFADGQYEARLTVADAAGNTSVATATVVVANTIPLVWVAAAAGIAGGLAAGILVSVAIVNKRRAGNLK